MSPAGPAGPLYVAGLKGMAGSALHRLLEAQGTSVVGWSSFLLEHYDEPERAEIGLEEGLRSTYEWYLQHLDTARR